MTIGLIGRKAGMTRVFTDAGESIPVTVIEALPNRVTQVKGVEGDGYRAIQVTFGNKKPSRITRAAAGHFAKAKVEPGEALVEFRLAEGEGAELAAGSELKVDMFAKGQVVDVALYESVFSVMESMLPEFDAFGAVRERTGSILPGIAPTSAYRCSDGSYVLIAANGDSIFRRLCVAMGRDDLAAVTRQTPGLDPDVTPACVNSCISGAMHFGDVNDPDSNISMLLAETRHFRMHEELGTDPSVYYIWDGAKA